MLIINLNGMRMNGMVVDIQEN